VQSVVNSNDIETIPTELFNTSFYLAILRSIDPSNKEKANKSMQGNAK
jgi:hypothetical protein